MQTSDVPLAARFTDGGLSVHYTLRVENARQADHPEAGHAAVGVAGRVLRRADVEADDVAIGTAQKEPIEMWVTASAGQSLVGANGLVTCA